jgi:hypothetical protein
MSWMRGASRRSWRAARLSAVVAAALCAACVEGYEVPSDPDPDGDPPPIPAGIAIEPGPSVGALSLRWPFVEQAQAYNIYWGTTADLTPSTRIASIIPPFIHTARTPGTIYYYAVTAVTATGVEGQPTTIISGMGRKTIALRVETPVAGAFLDDEVEVVFSYMANEEPTNVTAELGGVQTTMTYDPGISRFRGTLSLGSLASPAAYRLVVHATGPDNEIAEAITSVRFDRPPVLQVFSPDEGITVAPSTQLFTTCADDAPNGCASLIVYPAGSPNAPIVAGTTGISAALLALLADFAPGPLQLVIEARDSGGQIRRVTRTVIVP